MRRASASIFDGPQDGRRRLPPQGERRWVAILLALAMLALGSVTVGRAGTAGAEQFPTDAIGRLIIDGERLCTAFLVHSVDRRFTDRFGSGPTVMYENWIATAGHCLGGALVFQLGTAKYEVTRIIGYSAPDTHGHDVMVAAFLTRVRLPALEPAFGVFPQIGDPLMLIGYGGKALMMRVGPLTGYDERGYMEISNYASRGNSGGPVLIPGTRRVVGIGIETTINKPEGASLYYCALAGCGVKPPYIAAHIDRLKGIANFR